MPKPPKNAIPPKLEWRKQPDKDPREAEVLSELAEQEASPDPVTDDTEPTNILCDSEYERDHDRPIRYARNNFGVHPGVSAESGEPYDGKLKMLTLAATAASPVSNTHAWKCVRRMKHFALKWLI